jgi:DNA-binding MarR family transcriptional regulator
MKNTLLASALRTVTSRLFKTLKKHMNTVDNLSVTEVTTISNLYHQSLFPSEMAEMVKIKAQSMSQIINKLGESNLIIKTPSETDKRKILISLSEVGRQLVEQTRHERDEWLNDAIEQTLTPAEKKVLQEAVLLIDKLIEYNKKNKL